MGDLFFFSWIAAIFLTFFLWIAALFWLWKSKSKAVIKTCIISLVAIYIDVVGQLPILSVIILIYGLFYYLFCVNKNRLALCIMLCSTPVSISSAMIIQEMVLSQARDLKDILSKSKDLQELREKYFEHCNRCGILNYKIFLMPHEDVKLAYLTVNKLYGCRQIIPLDINKPEYESNVCD